VPAAGGQAVQITDRWSTYPRWSPDDRTIYYRADADTAYRGLFRVPAEGGSRAEIYFQEALGIPIPGGGPSLSPDGRNSVLPASDAAMSKPTKASPRRSMS